MSEQSEQRSFSDLGDLFTLLASDLYVQLDIPRLLDLRIVLLGLKVSGKSSAGNTILDREEFDPDVTTLQCVKRQGEVAGRQVTVVDTPGWERSSNLRSSQLTEETDDLDKSIFSLKRHTAVLVVRVDLRFTEENRATVQRNLERLGEGVWSRTMVLFTHGDWLGDTPIEQHIVSEGGDLKWLIEKCGNRYHVLNNQNRTEDQVVQLLEKIEEMVGWHIEMNSKSPEEKERSPQMFEFSPGFLSKERERSWWEKTRTGEQRELDLASLNTPPVFGGDDRSDLTSLFSSGYGTKTPQTASECPSDWDPRMSAKTERSGIRSVRSGTLRKARTLPFSDSKGLKPSLKKRSRQKLARHKTVE